MTKVVTFKRAAGKLRDHTELLAKLRGAGIPVIGKHYLLGVSSGTLTVSSNASTVIYLWSDSVPIDQTTTDEEEEL